MGQVGSSRWCLQPSRLRLRPGAQRLHLSGWQRAHQHRQYRSGTHCLLQSQQHDCSTCLLKPQCTTAPMRKVTRDVDEDVRDRVRALANTEAFRQSSRERKKVEMRFAHMKRILKFDRLRLRGLSGAKDEVLLTAIAQNLRRLAKLLCRPPPPLPVACPA